MRNQGAAEVGERVAEQTEGQDLLLDPKHVQRYGTLYGTMARRVVDSSNLFPDEVR